MLITFGGGNMSHSYFLCTFLFWGFFSSSKFLKGGKGIKIF